MPYEWLWTSLKWLWDNLNWIMPLGIFIFFFSLVRPVKNTVNNVKASAREIFTWDGFIIFIFLMIIALFLTGWISNLFYNI